MSGHGLAGPYRVHRRSEFERAYTKGFRVQGRFMTVFVVPNGLSMMRLGVSATRRLGPAVDRNRAKRLAREIFRRHTTAIGVDVIIVPRREMLGEPFADLEADYLAAVTRNRFGWRTQRGYDTSGNSRARRTPTV